MRSDPSYESEEMETNLESMFDHVNEMGNTDMPRDFLASLTKYFFKENGEKFTKFQKFQTEACLYLEHRRPHWRKRKAKSASLFLSIFFILEQEMLESNDEVNKRIFVEAFNSRETYLEGLMEEFDETDKLEKKMSSGPSIKVPGFLYDDDDDENESSADVENLETNSFDFNNCMMEVSDIVEDLEEVERSKYVKVFEKNGEVSIGIHITRIKALAKRKESTLTPLPVNVKSYPPEVKCATKTFTKLTSLSSVGASNTSAGYCMLINVKNMSGQAKERILGLFGRIAEANDDELINNEDAINSMDEGDLIQSQDFPTIYQSQTRDTLLNCDLCEYLSRSKTEFEQHMLTHPDCVKCSKKCRNSAELIVHTEEMHPEVTFPCHKCTKEFGTDAELKNHLQEHEMFVSYKNALEKNSKATPKSRTKDTTNDTKKKKFMNCYLLFVEKNKPKFKADNPSMTPMQINKLLGEAWKKLSKEEQKVYKDRAAEFNAEQGTVSCPKCGKMFQTDNDVVKHMMTDHLTSSNPTATTPTASTSTALLPVVEAGQCIMKQCMKCGVIFSSQKTLEAHQEKEHRVINPINAEVQEVPSSPVLFWVRLAGQPWPARFIANIDGEITEIELFDEEGSRKRVEHVKLKPFNKLPKIPKRSNLWKEAYAKALALFE